MSAEVRALGGEVVVRVLRIEARDIPCAVSASVATASGARRIHAQGPVMRAHRAELPDDELIDGLAGNDVRRCLRDYRLPTTLTELGSLGELATDFNGERYLYYPIDDHRVMLSTGATSQIPAPGSSYRGNWVWWGFSADPARPLSQEDAGNAASQRNEWRLTPVR